VSIDSPDFDLGGTAMSVDQDLGKIFGVSGGAAEHITEAS
jgi:hypothetical protein